MTELKRPKFAFKPTFNISFTSKLGPSPSLGEADVEAGEAGGGAAEDLQHGVCGHRAQLEDDDAAEPGEDVLHQHRLPGLQPDPLKLQLRVNVPDPGVNILHRI